jgi:hypothetical protein
LGRNDFGCGQEFFVPGLRSPQKRVRKTPSKAAMLTRLEMMGAIQSGRPESRDKIQCFALTKIWSSESLKVDEEKRRTIV